MKTKIKDHEVVAAIENLYDPKWNPSAPPEQIEAFKWRERDVLLAYIAQRLMSPPRADTQQERSQG